MMRLIDADLIQYEPMLSSKGNGMYEDVMVAYKNQIDDLPTIEPKKGKWELIIDGNELGEPYPCGCYCSECGFQSCVEDNYCPNCGADMRGKQND